MDPTCKFKVSCCNEEAFEQPQVRKIIVELEILCVDDSVTECSNINVSYINVLSVEATELQHASPAAAAADYAGGSAERLIDQSTSHLSIWKANIDWLQVSSPNPSCPMSNGLFCSLWAVDQNGGQHKEVWVDIFYTCLQGNCTCIISVAGENAQLKPCRVYAEAICKGDEDPDWEYMLRGACFEFRVIDLDCVGAYFKSNIHPSLRVTLVRK